MENTSATTLPSETPLVHKIGEEETGKEKLLLVIGVIGIILMGLGSGALLVTKLNSSIGLLGNGGVVRSGRVIGSMDEKTFSDSAEGTLEVGGINGEGTHKLIRGDATQTACLTSSVIDLDQVVGKKVKVWGQTFAPKKCGWLMDVGRAEILE